MRVVLDTDVLVSAMMQIGTPPALLLDRWRAGDYELVSSPALLGELLDVLQRPEVRRYIRRSAEELDDLVAAIRASTVWVEPELALAVIERDPADNRVLEAAVASSADVIVSGDRDLLDLRSYADIAIVPPSGFLASLG